MPRQESSSRRGESPPELGLEPGTAAPAFEAADANGELVSLDDLLAPGLPLLLLFTSPSCGPCQALLPDIAEWQAEHADRMTIAVAHGGDRDTAVTEAQEHDLERVLVDHDLSLQEAYGAGATPTGVLVAPDGTIASWVAPGADWIERLVVEAVTNESDGLPLGSPAPELALVGLDGEPVALVDPDRETLLVFWNPACGFCRSMHERLLTAERVADDRSPRLVIVSSGDEISTAAEGFISSVALDPEFSAGEAFHAGGTPMAVLLDRTGSIASPLAAGAEAVFALAHASGTSPSIEHVREGVAL